MIAFDKQAWYFFGRWIWLRFRARNATLKHVLRAMLWLNRSAYITKRSDYSERTYALKSDLLRYLYHAGLVDTVTKQKQTLTCSFCGGAKTPTIGAVTNGIVAGSAAAQASTAKLSSSSFALVATCGISQHLWSIG